MREVNTHHVACRTTSGHFAAEWAGALAAVYGAGRCPDARALRPLAVEIGEILSAETFRPIRVRRAGTRLAEQWAGCQAALPVSMRMIRRRAPELFELTGPDVGTRVEELLEQFAAGYAEGLADEPPDGQARPPVGVGLAELDGTVRDANRALMDMLGLSSMPDEPTTVVDFVHPDDVSTFVTLYRALANGERESGRMELRWVRTDDTVLWTDLTATLVRDASGRPGYVVGVMEDVSQRRRRASRPDHKIYHDQLTRLPNRSLISEQLRWAFSGQAGVRRIGLCHLDLDNLRAINASLGHQAGDQLLLAVAGRLQLLANDHLVTHNGGDEFAVFVPDPPGPGYLQELAAKILTGLAAPFIIDRHRLSVTVSLGIAEDAVTATTADEVRRAADAARTWAKADGGGRWVSFDAERDHRETQLVALAATVPAAVERNEFRLCYQPLVDLASGELAGVEALVRWLHPDHGLLPPARFIDLAERNGAIVPLGRWVLTEACRQARRWADRFGGAAPYVSVNVASRQLHEPAWLAEVSSVLADTGLDPRRLQLEFTERAVLGDGPGTVQTLCSLRDMGVRLAIDDFGTGYSSLSYLRTLPVHNLKIDGSFIRDLDVEETASADSTIVEALISMAHALGLVVTAEWVQTAAQANRLRSLGCDVGQGDWYGAAAPAGQLDPVLGRRLAG